MVLRRFWSSLANILKSSIETVWPEMLMWSCIGEGAFRCSLNLSPKFLVDSPIYSSLHSTLLHLNLYMTPLLLRIGSLSLGVIRRFLMVGPPFRCTSMPYFLQVLLKLSPSPWWYGTVICGFWSLLLLGLEFLLLFFFWGADVWFLNFTPLRAHVGYLHFFRVLNKCSSSSCSWVGPEEMVLALWNRVPIMLYLDGMGDGCPNAGIDLYVLAFCRQWSSACPLHLE